MIALALACGSPAPPPREPPSPGGLEAHCDAAVGEARVLEPAPGLFVAVGYDLANTLVLQGTDGRVVVDPGMSPARAERAKAALDAVTSGPVRAVIYTHSHIDHVGAADVWVEPGSQVWATDRWSEGFFHQYGTLLPSEASRGLRQFAAGVGEDELPCAAIGARAELGARIGVVAPTHTFGDEAALEVAGLSLRLLAVPGETDDHLAVIWPAREAVMPGDDWYAAFPNLYTIRGTRPRPVDRWIQSLDALRALDAAVLVPSHTVPVVGRDAVRDALVAHRDAIQAVRDAVVRGVNQGVRRDALVESVALPPELAGLPALQERYGRVDWSARAIADNTVGWFDGRAAALEPLPAAEVARRSVELMGGGDAVRAAAATAADPRWALHLLGLLEDAGERGLNELIAEKYEVLARAEGNANARGYLLVAARERRAGASEGLPRPVLSDDFVEGLPLPMLFAVLASRLRPEDAAGVHESLRFELDGDVFVVTIRHRVAEVVHGEPLPGTPPPVATLRTDARTWRRLSLELDGAAGALADGRLAIDGDPVALWRFLGRFDRGLAPPPSTLP